MQIALVGNGPVSYTDGSKVDTFDYVVRLNSAKTYKLAGLKTDLLFMSDASLIIYDRALDWRAFDGASLIYSLGTEQIVGGRRIQPLPMSHQSLREALISIGWTYEIKHPSTGMQAIAALLIMFPQATIHLFGFTHKVAPELHDGDKERKLTQTLISKGVLVQHSEFDRFPFNLLQGVKKKFSSFERRVLTLLRRRQIR